MRSIGRWCGEHKQRFDGPKSQKTNKILLPRKKNTLNRYIVHYFIHFFFALFLTNNDMNDLILLCFFFFICFYFLSFYSHIT